MPKPSKTTAQIHQALVASGVESLTPSQLQRARENKLVPALDVPVAAFYAAAAPLLGSGRSSYSEISLTLAAAGLPAENLAECIEEMLDVADWPAEEVDPDDAIGVEVAAQRAVGDDAGAELLDNFVVGSKRSGPLWRNTDLEHLGRATAVVEDVCAWSGGAQRIDRLDLSAVLGGAFDPETVMLGLSLINAALGGELPGTAMLDEVRHSDPHVLAAAVRAAGDMVALMRQLDVYNGPDHGRRYWQQVARGVPPCLILARLLPGPGALPVLHHLIAARVERALPAGGNEAPTAPPSKM